MNRRLLFVLALLAFTALFAHRADAVETRGGFATERTQLLVLAGVQAITGGGGGGGSSAGRVPLAHVRNNYASVSVTTAAYVQLVASTSGIVNEIEIFDSSGQTLVLAFGAAASEVDKVYITPGGNGRIPLLIPASTRVSIKAVSANATVGEIDINFYQ